MLKSCSTCGGIHGFDENCPKRIEYTRQRQAGYDRGQYQYTRDSKADRFRRSMSWQRKREEIRARDLNLCRYCFLVRHRITTAGLSVHHIISLNTDYSKRLQSRNLITLCRECHELAERGRIPAETLRKLTVEKLKMHC